ncbi:hypothetical protein, partial [Baaleninema sp.]|uniref:hypothetical protein n=1 Tax=Baaleninema sp. TaxID=3101197 RepID=UPI003D0548B1
SLFHPALKRRGYQAPGLFMCFFRADYLKILKGSGFSRIKSQQKYDIVNEISIALVGFYSELRT